MPNEFRRIGRNEPVLPNVARDIIPRASAFSFSADEIQGPGISCRPFVNDRLNSRTVNKLPKGQWKIRCMGDVGLGSRPKYLLHRSDRIIIQGDGPWELYKDDCTQIASGYLDGSDVFLDIARDEFCFADHVGMIESRRLSDGAKEYSASLIFSHKYHRSMMADLGNRIMVASTEREIDQDCEEKPKDSTLEILEISEPRTINRDGELESGKIIATLIKDTLILRTAIHNDELVAVTPGQICIIDRDLNIESALNDDFDPVAISLDGSGIIYLVLRTNDVLKLRAVTKHGERLFSAELPGDLDYRSYPPIIGYDHRIYLLGSNTLLAFARGGLCLWEYRPGHPIPGAIITPLNELIISSGSEVGVFDPAGHYQVVYDFDGETVQTPPALTEKGEILVATDQRLYCLTTAA